MWRTLTLLLLATVAGCTLLFAPGDAPEKTADAGGSGADGSAAPCTPRAGDLVRPVFGSPAPIASAWENSDYWLGGLSADEQLIAVEVFTLSGNSQDAYISERASAGGFLEPVPLIEGEGTQYPAFVERDGQALWYVSDESGDRDLYRIRVDTPQERVAFPLNTEASESRIWIPPEGGRIYFVRDGRLERAAPTAEGPQTDVLHSELGSVHSFTMSCDEREVIFSRDEGDHDLYWAARAEPADAFTEPAPLTEINTANDEAFPWLSEDGQRLYFNYDAAISGDEQPDFVHVVTRQD